MDLVVPGPAVVWELFQGAHEATKRSVAGPEERCGHLEAHTAAKARAAERFLEARRLAVRDVRAQAVMRSATSYRVTELRVPGVSPAGIALNISSPLR